MGKTTHSIILEYCNPFAIFNLQEPDDYHISLRTTNYLERIKHEVCRRYQVVSIFPNTDSAEHLIGTILMDIHGDWKKPLDIPGEDTKSDCRRMLSKIKELQSDFTQDVGLDQMNCGPKRRVLPNLVE